MLLLGALLHFGIQVYPVHGSRKPLRNISLLTVVLRRPLYVHIAPSRIHTEPT